MDEPFFWTTHLQDPGILFHSHFVWGKYLQWLLSLLLAKGCNYLSTEAEVKKQFMQPTTDHKTPNNGQDNLEVIKRKLFSFDSILPNLFKPFFFYIYINHKMIHKQL